MSSSRTETQSVAGRRCRRWAISVAEGTIVEWRKQPGDWVEADETICDVTTDKVDVEIPSPGQRAAGADRWSSRARRVDGRRRRSPRSTPARAPGEAHPRGGRRRPPPAPERRTRRGDRRGRPLRVLLPGGPADRRRARHRPRRRSRAPGSAGGCARRTCSPTSRRDAGNGRPSRSRSLHTESPYRPDARRAPAPRPADEPAAERRRAPRADVADAPGDRPAHGREPPDRGALHDDRRGRHVAGRARAAPS